MTAILKHINLKLPSHVPVPTGVPEALVMRRELRGQYCKKRTVGYETNRDIKTWSFYLQMKALTGSYKIQKWFKQRDHLLSWTQVTLKTFYKRLNEAAALQLLQVENGDIILSSYHEALATIDLKYYGSILVEYNPKKHDANQIFQYILRAEECRTEIDKQRETFRFKLEKNLHQKSDYINLLVQMGADRKRLETDIEYLRKRLLELQIISFREGSEILDKIFERRADINRSVQLIQQTHCYKSASSASYMKRRLLELNLVKITKRYVESKVRARFYYDDKGTRKDGYKWNMITKKTVWFLTDQIEFLYESKSPKRVEKRASNAA